MCKGRLSLLEVLDALLQRLLHHLGALDMLATTLSDWSKTDIDQKRTGGDTVVSLGMGCGAFRAFTMDTSESAQNQPIVIMKEN